MGLDKKFFHKKQAVIENANAIRWK